MYALMGALKIKIESVHIEDKGDCAGFLCILNAAEVGHIQNIFNKKDVVVTIFKEEKFRIFEGAVRSIKVNCLENDQDYIIEILASNISNFSWDESVSNFSPKKSKVITQPLPVLPEPVVVKQKVNLMNTIYAMFGVLFLFLVSLSIMYIIFMFTFKN